MVLVGVVATACGLPEFRRADFACHSGGPCASEGGPTPHVGGPNDAGAADPVDGGGPVDVAGDLGPGEPGDASTPDGAPVDGSAPTDAGFADAAPSVSALSLTAARTTLNVGEQVQLVTTLMYSDGTSVDVSSAAAYTSQSPAIATVGATGLVRAVGAGSATIVATHRGLTAQLQLTAAGCQYPGQGTTISASQPFPPIYWSAARRTNGTTLPFALESFHCDAAYARYSTLAFIVTAGWVPQSRSYIQAIPMGLDAAGMLVVYLLVQDDLGQPANASYAHSFVTMHANGSEPSLRVGDGDALPAARAFQSSNLVSALPTTLVVRRSDMMIVADEATAPAPGDRAGSAATFGGPSCVEETFEPNDSAPAATQLAIGAIFDGGVCTPSNRDFYRIAEPGNWRLRIEFSHAVGDLDIRVWDRSANAFRTSGNLGSVSSSDDERFDGTGDTTVAVMGFGAATAPYTLHLTAR